MRLDKYLADCGAGTRSEIKKLIRAGAVEVANTAPVKPDMQVNENTEVFLNGVRQVYKRYIYLMMNKPEGYLSATWDRHKPVVADLIPDEYVHFDAFPVGRLDIDTVGLCVLTNDGALAHRILSPSKHIPKTYFAKVNGLLGKADIEAFAAGMDLGDFTARPSELNILCAGEDESSAEIIIYEGKFHQIKRMFEKVGRRVTYLKRTRMNGLKLDEELGEGEIRELTDKELELLTDGV